jgi:integrase
VISQPSAYLSRVASGLPQYSSIITGSGLRKAILLIYLNEPALDIIRALSRRSNNLYVIPGNRVGAPSGAIDRAWSRVRLAAELRDVRLHDLRHSFASIGIVDGLSLPVIGALLGHKHAATTARYAHLAPGPLRTANDAVGSRIAAAMGLAVPAENPKSQPKRAGTH